MIENFKDYTTYLNHWIKAQPNDGFGLRKKISDHLGVQTSYFSQVLSGKVVLKEDYALLLNDYLRHDYLESDYFLTLVAIDRASSHGLKNYYQNKAQEIRAKIKQVVTGEDQKVKILDEESQYDEFYSSWIYSAVHALAALEGITLAALKNQLEISKSSAKKIIHYLSELGLIIKEENQFKHSGKGLHLSKDHKWVQRHHINWKIKTLEILQQGQPEDLHYTSVANFSAHEAEIIKDLMRSMIRDVRAHISKAKDENIYCYSLDFFPVVRSKL